jgi:hypothetical protein
MSTIQNPTDADVRRARLALHRHGYRLSRNRRGAYTEGYGDWLVIDVDANTIVGWVDDLADLGPWLTD